MFAMIAALQAGPPSDTLMYVLAVWAMVALSIVFIDVMLVAIFLQLVKLNKRLREKATSNQQTANSRKN